MLNIQRHIIIQHENKQPHKSNKLTSWGLVIT